MDKQDTHAFVQDWAENVGSYAASTSKTSPGYSVLQGINRELKAKKARIDAGQARVDDRGVAETWTAADARSQNDMVQIARGLDPRLRGMGAGGVDNVTDTGEPIPAGSGAAGRVNAAILEFVTDVNPGRNGGNGGTRAT